MLEVCIDSLESAINAIHGGADELEVCSSLADGGLTPTVGLVYQIQAMVKKVGSEKPIHRTCVNCRCSELTKKPRVNVMLRCRPGSDFYYTITEMDTMIADLAMFKAMDVDRFVFGALTSDQYIDEKNCALIVNRAHPKPVTFHRAFDLCTDPLLRMEEVIKLGFNRVLTSGQKPSVGDQEAFQLISALMTMFKDKIEIMPGAGINYDNVRRYIKLGCTIVHSSCKAMKELPKVNNNLCMGTGSTESICYTDETNVVKLKSVIKNIKNEISKKKNKDVKISMYYMYFFYDVHPTKP